MSTHDSDEARDHDEAIEDAASLWLAERVDGFSEERAREFAQWRAASARHAAALDRLEQACALLEKMPAVRERLVPMAAFPVEQTPVAPARPRRWRVAFASGLGFAAALAVLVWWQQTQPKIERAEFATTAGGYERVALTDGSVVELNASSRVSLAFSARERRVTLVTGEAHFTVAHDTARPFVVRAGDVSVRAVGTAFNVRLATAAVEVLVTEGRVRVNPMADKTTAAGAAEAEMPLVEAGQRAQVVSRSIDATSPPHAQIEKIEAAAMQEALAWQERKLVFAETPLREVIAQFNRRNRVQLRVPEPGLAARLVGGTFAADNVEAFVRLLEGTGVAVAEHHGESEIVLRAVR